jgi:hypothetical protein
MSPSQWWSVQFANDALGGNLDLYRDLDKLALSVEADRLGTVEVYCLGGARRGLGIIDKAPEYSQQCIGGDRD